jgi:ribosomal protein L7Ae-like RNA K-turn-binding protein
MASRNPPRRRRLVTTEPDPLLPEPGSSAGQERLDGDGLGDAGRVGDELGDDRLGSDELGGDELDGLDGDGLGGDGLVGELGVDEAEPESGPLRRCIITRERLPKERMIRFVVGPDRRIVPDLTARLPGRGIWLSASGDVLVSGSLQQDGRQKDKRGDGGDRHLVRAFARAARGPVSVPSDLCVLLQAALVRRIGELLGLARRAGQAVSGYEKAREALRTGRYRLVLQASDGSEAERMRFLSGFGASSGGPALTIIDPLPGEALGRVFGRDYVVHVAVAPGKLAESLVVEAGRLAGLRNGSVRTMGSARTTGREIASVNDVAGADEYT